MTKRCTRRIGGFTLLELMVTLVILAIVAALALPSFTNLIRSTRLSGVTNEFIGAAALARAEAIKSNRGGTLCASSNGTACGTDWSAGWIVFSDADRDGTVDTGEAVLRYRQALQGIAVSSSLATAFRFGPRGECINCASGRFGVGADSLVIQASPCSTGQPHVRGMRVLRTGAVSFERRNCT